LGLKLEIFLTIMVFDFNTLIYSTGCVATGRLKIVILA